MADDAMDWLEAKGKASFIYNAPKDIMRIMEPGNPEPIILIKPDGRLFWRGREVETDDDFRGAMLHLAAVMMGRHDPLPAAPDWAKKMVLNDCGVCRGDKDLCDQHDCGAAWKAEG